jgi:DNA-binding transcriptional ArsR family regulator
VNSDKNQSFLGKQLKILGQKIRIDILKKLKHSQEPLSFSKLQREVLEGDFSSPNFSFHLSELKKCEIINSTEDGYYITRLGKRILDNILSIEQILLDKSKTRMIRTSKYSKEKFDSNKITDYLITEGGLERFLARKIAREVEERLTRTNIEYLTAPLMREYINAILLENGLEEVRHKLTRLGTPPFEAFKLFNSKEMTPDKFIKKLGSDVSEQFLLLNLIPKQLADSYLSGEIALLHLNYWSLKPLSIYLNTDTVVEYIFNNKFNNLSKVSETRDSINLALNFFDLLYQIKPFYSEDVVLGDFNNKFLFKYSKPKDNNNMINLLTSQIFRYNESFQDNQCHLTLDFNSRSGVVEENPINSQINKIFLNSLSRNYTDEIKPLLLYDFSDYAQISAQNGGISDLLSSALNKNIIFYNRSNSNLLNSTLIKICNPMCNEIILDKILINLHSISVEANQNDDLFFDFLQDKLNLVFEFFKFKENLVKKKLNINKQWLTLCSKLFTESKENLFQEATKSISFFGLNTAITNHCGIELDRTESSMRFTLEVLNQMRRIIEEQNEEDYNRYKLNQPHNDIYLGDSWRNELKNQGKTIDCYSPRFIRENSSLKLTDKIDLFRKFEEIINGGSVFNYNMLNGCLKTLFDSQLNAISFTNQKQK